MLFLKTIPLLTQLENSSTASFTLSWAVWRDGLTGLPFNPAHMEFCTEASCRVSQLLGVGGGPCVGDGVGEAVTCGIGAGVGVGGKVMVRVAHEYQLLVDFTWI